jgi:hypothetical protein
LGLGIVLYRYQYIIKRTNCPRSSGFGIGAYEIAKWVLV